MQEQHDEAVTNVYASNLDGGHVIIKNAMFIDPFTSERVTRSRPNADTDDVHESEVEYLSRKYLTRSPEAAPAKPTVEQPSDRHREFAEEFRRQEEHPRHWQRSLPAMQPGAIHKAFLKGCVARDEKLRPR